MTMVTHHCRTAVPQWLVSGIFGGHRQARGFLAPFDTKTVNASRRSSCATLLLRHPG
jgi:hypothetical protein